MDVLQKKLEAAEEKRQQFEIAKQEAEELARKERERADAAQSEMERLDCLNKFVGAKLRGAEEQRAQAVAELASHRAAQQAEAQKQIAEQARKEGCKEERPQLDAGRSEADERAIKER